MYDNIVLIDILSWLPFKIYRLLYAEHGFSIKDYNGTIIDPIRPSTITVGGRFTNIKLHEKNDIERFRLYGAAHPIMLIGSNFGEILAEGFVKPGKKIKTTKRGRKAKPKDPKKRIQGTGDYFNSQITFFVLSLIIAGKLYKFKVFRNGKFQVPGVLATDLSDIQTPLNELKKFLTEFNNRRNRDMHRENELLSGFYLKFNSEDSEIQQSVVRMMYDTGAVAENLTDEMRTFVTQFQYSADPAPEPDVEITDHCIQMRNCKTILNDDCLTINTLALGSMIAAESRVNKEIGIDNVEYQTAQNSSKVVVKFLRPAPDKPFKQTTLKILKQKINFEGAVSFDGVHEIYWWLNDLLLDNYERVINDPDIEKLESDSSDTDADSRASSDEEDEQKREVEEKVYVFDPYEF